MLGPLCAAFGELEVPTQRVVYSDDAADEVCDELFGLDGVLAWAKTRSEVPNSWYRPLSWPSR
jgi:hypothetical protein